MTTEDRPFQPFREKSPLRNEVARTFERAGFTITYATQSQDRPLWGYFVRPNEQLGSLFGTTQEILVWVSEFPDFQARTVVQAQNLHALNRPRLCETFCFLITADPETESKVDAATAALSTAFVGYSIRDFRSLLLRPGGDFVRDIQTRLFSKDLYFLSTAITSRDAFYGRRQLINELQAMLRRGSSHVALFGLRKMGKTSLLYRVLELLKAGRDVMWAHLDVQRIDAINPSVGYLLWSLGEQVFDSNPEVQRLGGYRLFGTKSTFSSLREPSEVPELFDHDLRRVLSRTDHTLVILLDEVELIHHSRWQDGYVRAWRLLRALDQEFSGRLSYFVTGTNPRCVELNRIGDSDNPTYNYFDLRFLDPLSTSECRELLTRLGKPMGIVWHDAAIDRLTALVGGHPFLLRSFGSFLHRADPQRRTEVAIGLERVNAAVEGFLASRSSTFSQMIEVLRDHYPNEIEMLDELAAGNVNLFRTMASHFPEDVTHLQGYGLIGDPQTARGLSVELLQTWLQRRARARTTPPTGAGAQALAPGDSFEGYVIEEAIGHPGGYGRVFRAREPERNGSQAVAIKILSGGSLSALQREISALQSVNHPNVVKFIDYGQSSGGELYIVMELLEGHTLGRRCQRGTRLSQEDATRFMTVLLGALNELHPKQRVVDELRAKAELSEHEFQLLEEARYGYVHRDIKPDNVVCCIDRGPVLIDFGISVRVAERVSTQSATPGYLPPDGVFGRWDPDVDLFQLGVTMLQAVLGLTYSGDNLEDLQGVGREELGEPLKGVLMKLTAARREDRFGSAADVVDALRLAPKGA
jgi:serine/threonine-protein kinase